MIENRLNMHKKPSQSTSRLNIRVRVEVNHNRRLSRDSSVNSRRFAVDLYDELSNRLSSGAPLTNMIGAFEIDSLEDLVEEANVEITLQAVDGPRLVLQSNSKIPRLVGLRRYEPKTFGATLQKDSTSGANLKQTQNRVYSNLDSRPPFRFFGVKSLSRFARIQTRSKKQP